MIKIPNELKAELDALILSKSSEDTWQDIADFIAIKYNIKCSETWCRRYFKRLVAIQDEIETQDGSIQVDDFDTMLTERLIEIKKEQRKARDERLVTTRYINLLSREETCKDIAQQVVDKISEKLPFLPTRAKDNSFYTKIYDSSKAGVLLISDWHYGLEVDNFSNYYNPKVAIDRVQKLKTKVIEIAKKENLQELYILNLGDLISGRIHRQLDIQNREDVITQILEVTEILAEFIEDLAKELNILINVYSCSDNHSRIEANKKQSFELESLYRITPWYLVQRLKGIYNVNIHKDNFYANDIINFECCGHNMLAVHGHKDKAASLTKDLQNFVREQIDAIFSAHLHHFNADEENMCVRVSNGSLMGTDENAMNLRKRAKPSQTLVMATKQDPAEQIYRIILE